MKWTDALSLGRVSNLPTVWTNMLAAVVLVGAIPASDGRAGSVTGTLVLLIIALSLFYIGGMYLNDAFDATIDAKERPGRPIPSGRVTRNAVFAWGFGMMAIGLLALLVVGFSIGRGNGLFPFMGGVALAVAIVVYNMWHKGNPVSPILMGLCRVFVYVTAAWCFTITLPKPLWISAIMVMCYLIGLTYVAKQENLNTIGHLWPLLFLAAPVVYGVWLSINEPATVIYLIAFSVWAAVALYFVKRRQAGDIPRAVVSLIAGMCLLDAVFIAGQGHALLAILGVAGFCLTLYLQRYIAGT